MYCYTSSDIVKVFNYIKCLVMLLGEHTYFDLEDFFFLKKKKFKRMWVEETVLQCWGSSLPNIIHLSSTPIPALFRFSWPYILFYGIVPPPPS